MNIKTELLTLCALVSNSSALVSNSRLGNWLKKQPDSVYITLFLVFVVFIWVT